MARKRKPPSVNFKSLPERLWGWLVDNEGAELDPAFASHDPQLARRLAITKIMQHGDPRGMAVAEAMLIFQVAAEEMETPIVIDHLAQRAEALDEVTKATSPINALIRLAGELAPKAEDWLVIELRAGQDALRGALVTLEKFRLVVESLGGNVWGADLAPNLLDTLDRAGLRLAEAGFNSDQIAALLGTGQPGEPERFKKRVQRARTKTGVKPVKKARKPAGTPRQGASPSLPAPAGTVKNRAHEGSAPTKNAPRANRPPRRP